MSFALTQTKFLGFADLYWGTYIYGGVMTALCVTHIIWPELTWYDWVFMLAAEAPLATCFILMMIDRKSWLYVWTNWYFSFFALCIGTFNLVTQTVILILMLINWGSSSITFRGAAKLPGESISPDHLFSFGSEWAVRGYDALPLFAKDALQLSGAATFNSTLNNGDALNAQAQWVIILLLISVWVGWGVMGYFTLINYSYFKEASTTAASQFTGVRSVN